MNIWKFFIILISLIITIYVIIPIMIAGEVTIFSTINEVGFSVKDRNLLIGVFSGAFILSGLLMILASKKCKRGEASLT